MTTQSDSTAEIDLAALVGSRLCHDLISPIGAIGNGLELMELAGQDSEELSLIKASFEAASARIKFFRIAFGSANDGQIISAREIVDTLNTYFADSRATLNWVPTEDQPRSEVKCAYLALACLESAMPWGGQIEVRRATDAWVLHAKAERFKVDEGLWGLLRNGGDMNHLGGNSVHFGLLSQMARQDRRPISVNQGDQSLSIMV